MNLAINSIPSPKETIATVTAQGQVTLPAQVRKHLGVNKSDKVAFVIEPAGEVRVKAPKYPTVASLRGAAGSFPRALAWKEMKRMAMEDRFKLKYSK